MKMRNLIKSGPKALLSVTFPLLASNFRNQASLSQYLSSRNILGIADIDTRKLTRILREKGAQNRLLNGW